jgi:hypothetical protein
VTITKSITIETIGMVAGVLASGVNGIIINATATDTVILRGLSIDGAGTTIGLNGIRFINGAKLVVENCTIQNFSQAGIDVETTGASQLFVNNSTINKNNNGIVLQPTATGSASATVAHSNVVQNKTGILLYKGIASARNSTFSGNSLSGITSAGSPDITRVNVDQSTVSDNGIGVNAIGSTASAYLSNTTVTNNNTAIQVLSGAVYTFGNNRIFGNTNAGAVPTSASQQ